MAYDVLRTAAAISYLLHNSEDGQNSTARAAIGEDPFSDPPIGRVHDWRNHVPDEIVEVWGELPPIARAAVYFIAARSAGAENWD